VYLCFQSFYILTSFYLKTERWTRGNVKSNDRQTMACSSKDGHIVKPFRKHSRFPRSNSAYTAGAVHDITPPSQPLLTTNTHLTLISSLLRRALNSKFMPCRMKPSIPLLTFPDVGLTNQRASTPEAELLTWRSPLAPQNRNIKRPGSHKRADYLFSSLRASVDRLNA